MSEAPHTAPRYTIGEIADLAGVSRRTVRYYVQRELLPAPDGLGRGAHYTDEHLARLIRIRGLQEAGVPLVDIGRALDGAPPPALALPAPLPGRPTPASTPPAAVDRWSRAVIADGVELHVRDSALGEAALAALLQLITHHVASPSHSPVSTKENPDDQR
ncbi:MAG: MerR family transcriptional regulator [Deltaproteobacteria bacterium HGW-Deltaproteobacteria-14]|jgi:DNA-binding transcriptional MerR regulator|nr:MAG: MerR family transcriptional regulator [Deltaproteobacteria bacterium HGW-Deltaproteobacteria-14]